MQAGVNSAAPAALLLGIGVLTLGFVPRLTSIVCWGMLAWAFLLDMLGSALKVNHWVMDTSLLYHPALAPAVNPNWRSSAPTWRSAAPPPCSAGGASPSATSKAASTRKGQGNAA